jgi:hypothetical protein
MFLKVLSYIFAWAGTISILIGSCLVYDKFFYCPKIPAWAKFIISGLLLCFCAYGLGFDFHFHG